MQSVIIVKLNSIESDAIDNDNFFFTPMSMPLLIMLLKHNIEFHEGLINILSGQNLNMELMEENYWIIGLIFCCLVD